MVNTKNRHFEKSNSSIKFNSLTHALDFVALFLFEPFWARRNKSSGLRNELNKWVFWKASTNEIVHTYSGTHPKRSEKNFQMPLKNSRFLC